MPNEPLTERLQLPQNDDLFWSVDPSLPTSESDSRCSLLAM